MNVLLLLMSLTIGYINWMCQSFLSGCAFFLSFSPFFNHGFDLIVVDFDLSLPVGDVFVKR